MIIAVVVPVVVAFAGYVLFDPNGFKPRIAEAVRAATGRELAVRGPITVAFSLAPTLKASDVRLSNPAGFSRPQMVTLGDVEAQLALWPLLRGRIEVIRLVLTQPDLRLETNAQGAVNWRFAPVKAGAGAAPAAVQAAAEDATPGAPRFAVASVRINGGRVSWFDGSSGAERVVDIRTLRGTSPGPMAPMSVTSDLRAEGHDVALALEMGPLEQLFGASVPTGWPLQVVARVDGARLAATGTVERPLEGRGYQLALDAAVPDLAELGAGLHRKLPPLHDVSASARISDATGVAVVTGLVARSGASDLGSVLPRLSLDRLEISASGLDAAIQGEVEGAFSGTKIRGAVRLGPPRVLLAGAFASVDAGAAVAPFPVDIRAEAAGAFVTAKGGIASPAALSGLDVALSARVPDLEALGPLFGRALPAMHDIAFDGQVSDGEGGMTRSVVLHGLTLAAPQGDAAGDIAIGFAPRLSFKGQLSGKRLDVDALGTLFPVRPLASAAAHAPVAAKSVAEPTAAAGPQRSISDTPIDMAGFDLVDADLQSNLAELHFGGASIHDLSGRVVMDRGRFILGPAQATLPGGRLDLRVSADTRQTEPVVTLALNAPGMALKPFLTAAALPDDVTGTVEIAADVTSTGHSLHRLASNLFGRVGVVMVEGELDNRLLGPSLSDVLRAARLPVELMGGAGRTKLRCFATRVDFTHGLGNVATLVLDSARMLVQGAGAINLGDETLALRLRPLLRTGGPGVVIPVRVAGGFANPSVAVDAGAALETNAIGLLGGIGGVARNPLAAVAGAVAGGGGPDVCAPALIAARAARPLAK